MSTLRAARTLVTAGPLVWWDAVRTMAVAAVVEIGLRTVKLHALARLLGVRLRLDPQPSPHPPSGPVEFSPRECQRLQVARRVLRHRPFNGTCLRRSLVAGWILRKRDHGVRIGVRKAGDTMAAHSWVEVDGISLEPDAEEFYSSLAPIEDLS
ncbi:MAG TPA: lasso peptide biosynthesis B2 protein [Ruania sp.]|nr:lasso peptide biosynthesis B2 protein [Ruania sp.]